MGQYYKFIILNDDGTIALSIHPHDFTMGAKLMELAWIDTLIANTIEFILSPESEYHKSRCVLAGDYADAEPDGENLYCMAHKSMTQAYKIQRDLPYIVNHTKRVYIDKSKLDPNSIHPLLLLIADGNGRGSGDYRGSQEHLVGGWSRDVISMEYDQLYEFTEVSFDFCE